MGVRMSQRLGGLIGALVAACRRYLGQLYGGVYVRIVRLLTTSWARSGNGSECDENEERRELHAGVMVDERASKDPGARVIDGFSLSANTAVRLFVASSGLSISNATSA